MSSGKSLNFELDGENSVTVKLSDSGRISLSDITAATLGNLEDGNWIGNTSSESIDNSTAVLRPWEDNSITDRSAVILKPPHGYEQQGKHKRHLDEVQLANEVEGYKRPRLQSHVSNSLSPVQTISYNDEVMGGNQSYQPSSYVPSFNYAALTQSLNIDNQPQKSYFPWTKNESPVMKNEQPFYDQSDLVHGRQEKHYNNQSLKLHYRNAQPPTYDQSMQLLTGHVQPPTRGITDYQSVYPLKPITNFEQITNTEAIMPNLTRLPNLQNTTPVAKKSFTSTLRDCKPVYNSPGFDSRFNESLSNLLGSPPPDSPLSKNPFFGDLQALLTTECKKDIVPQTLFTAPGKDNTEAQKENVFTRERNLQEQFDKLEAKQPEEIRQLSSFFRYQSAMIETERFRTLHESQYPGSYKESVNTYYDNQLHKVMDRVEKSVKLLNNAKKENTPTKVIKTRPHLSRESVRLMESWYTRNLDHPYPTSTGIELLAQAGNISIDQVKKWFANKRNRSQNTRSLTEIAMQKRKLGQLIAR